MLPRWRIIVYLLMKTISTLFILTCATLIAGAQSFKDQYFSSLGFSPCLDFVYAPAQVICPAYRIDHSDTVCFLHQNTGVGIISIMYEGRYNIIQPSDNFAVSIKGKPTLSLAISNSGMGAFYLPIGAGVEIGDGATYQTTSSIGFTLTAGYSLNVLPLLKSGDPYDKAAQYDNVTLKSSWGAPFIATGIRYWNKTNKLREINVLYSFASNDKIPAGAEQLGFETDGNVESNYKFYSSFRICVSWMIYLNY